MPKLCRMRLVSIGHPRARFEDVTLDFTDQSGHATNSILWLRNGGGKSSLLSLYFAGVRPNLRDFLGRRAENDVRHLSNYVLPGDHGLVVCEWELDSDSRLLDDAPVRYLTGVFYERRLSNEVEHNGDSAEVDRLFFAAVCSDNEPRLTLDGLPIFSDGSGGRTRKTRAGFKRVWQTLRQEYPHHEVFVEDARQHKFVELLRSRGIDPELYFYQICMNEREGGASELFAFDDQEDFVDFLLGMTLDEDYARQVRDQLGAFREHLVVRNEELKPEHELCAGLVQRVRMFAKVADERDSVNRLTDSEYRKLREMSRSIEARIEELDSSCHDLTGKIEESRCFAEDAHAMAGACRREAAVLRFIAARQRHEQAIQQFDQSKQAMEAAARLETIWQAAVPLKRVLDAERQAQRYRAELQRKQETHADLIARLRAVATGLANALDYEAQQQRGVVQRLREEAQQSREEAQTLRSKATAVGEAAARAESEAKSIQEQLDEAEDERRTLIAGGVIQPDEPADAARRRLQRSIDESRERIQELEKQLDARRRDEQSTRETHRDVQTRYATLTKEHQLLQGAFEEAERRRRSLENDATMLKLLQTATIELEAALSPTVQKAEEERRKMDEALVVLRIAAAEDDRTILQLEESRILPPSRDVEAILEDLLKLQVKCWSGWSYIEANVPQQERRAYVERMPHLAAGVIVANADYHRVREMLERHMPRLQSPVVLAPADAIHDGDALHWTVVGPTSEAHFSQEAGVRELHDTHERKVRRADEVACHERWREDLARLSYDLQAYRREYPKGWWSGNAALRAKCESDLDGLSTTINTTDDRLRALAEEIQEIEAASRHASETRRGHEVHLVQAESFIRQHAAKEAERIAARDLARRRSEKLRREQSDLSHRAGECDQKSTTLLGQVTHAAERAKAIEEELKRVANIDEGRRLPVLGDLDHLRHEHNILDLEFRQKVGSDTLEQLAAQRDDDAWRERQELERILSRSTGIGEADVRAQLETLGPNRATEEAYETAKEAHWEAKQRNGQDSQAKARSEKDLQEAQKKRQELEATGTLPELEPSEPIEEVELRATKVEHEAAEQQQLAAAFEEEANEFQASLQNLRHRIETLTGDRSRIGTIRESYGRLFDRLGEDHAGRVSDPIQLDEAQIGSHIDALGQTLRQCASDHDQLDQRREEAAKDVHRWARDLRFAGLKHSVATSFAEFEAATLETKASFHLEKLELRLFHIEQKLKEADKQRDIVVRVILSAVDECLRLLDRVSKQSRLPPTLPKAGRQFLQITTSASENPADRRGRINDLVDELLDRGEIGGGIELIQKAVRRVASPMRVRVLHPDLEQATQRVDIAEMRRFSGGERLTCAILLYCTLARMRRHEGSSTSRSSVLLLDNPIGTVSRVRFLDMQREVARAMNIQLIYATGVRDLDAVGTLEKVVSLKNSRMDLRTGRRVVELEDDGEAAVCGELDAVHVGFKRREAASAESGEDAYESV